MPLLLFCACGRSTPLPESSAALRCSECGARIEVTWFGGTAPFEQLQSWRIRTGRVEAVRSWRVEFVERNVSEKR